MASDLKVFKRTGTQRPLINMLRRFSFRAERVPPIFLLLQLSLLTPFRQNSNRSKCENPTVHIFLFGKIVDNYRYEINWPVRAIQIRILRVFGELGYIFVYRQQQI